MNKTPESISSEIVMKANTHRGWFLLVEGDFDLRFWEHRVHTKWHLVQCGGKKNIVNMVHGLLMPPRCVALADKDYDELLGRLLPDQAPLVYTDGNDLEMTLLLLSDTSTDTLLKRLLCEWIDPSRIEMVYEHLRAAATCFGCLRYLNARHQWGVNFADTMRIQHQAYCNHRELIFNERQLWIAFAKKANLDVSQIEAAFQSDPELQMWRKGWALIQGHDFLQLLAIAMGEFRRKDASLAEVDERFLQGQIRLSTASETLKRTCMLQTIEAKAGGMSLLKT